MSLNVTNLIPTIYTHQFICLFGLIPFAIIFLLFDSAIAFIIFFNGIWYHLTLTKFTRIFDIFCNMILIIIVNLNTIWQPGTLYCTIFAIIAWTINIQTKKSTNIASIIHVLATQWVLCYGLYRFVI